MLDFRQLLQRLTRRLTRFQIGLLAIVAVALVLRLLIFQFSLPYVENPDEPVFFLQGLVSRGLFDLNGYLDYYPPLFIGINILTQFAIGANGGGDLSRTVEVLRLLAVIVNVLTVVCIAYTARIAAGDIAGWIAGGLWGLAPIVLREGILANPDPWVYFFVSASLWLATVALTDDKRRHWAIWSVAVGLIATLTKYPVVPTIGVGGLVALWLTMRDRARGLRYIAIQAILVAAVAFFIFVLYPFNEASMMEREAGTAVNSGLANFLNVARVRNNLHHVFVPLDATTFFIVTAAGAVAYGIAAYNKRRRVHIGVIGLAAFIVIAIPWLVSAFSEISILHRMKDALPATTAACVIIGAAVTQIMWAIPQRFQRYAAIIPVLISAWFIIPFVQADIQLVTDYRQPDTRVAIRQWADVNLEPGGVIVYRDNHKTFNPFWGGLQFSAKWFDSEETTNIMTRMPTEWFDYRSFWYAAIPVGDVAAMEQTDDGRAYLGQMLRLRDFTAAGWRGPATIVYRLWRMDVETNVAFGDSIFLLGYDAYPTTAAPGDTIPIRLYWNAVSPPPLNYSMFIHLVPLDEWTPLSQVDGTPGIDARPTSTWIEPSETLISPIFELPIPSDLPAGDYRILLGLYNYETNVRLPVMDADSPGDPAEAYSLPMITVTR